MAGRRLVIAWLVCTCVAPTAGYASETPGDAIASGDMQVSLRYRFEHVNQDGLEHDANASTARLRLGYATGEWRHWSAFGELDYVGEVLFDDFDSGAGTSPERIGYPVVADPEGGDLNQLYLDYRMPEAWVARLGRQRILLDDQRFVGGVGWRQNEQTFDAVSVQGKAGQRVGVLYAWVANVNRIFGDTVPSGDHRMNTHLLNVRLDVTGDLAATGYAYLIDNEDDPTASTSTFGVRLAGSATVVERRFRYLADVAVQSERAGAPAFDARYLRTEAEWTCACGPAMTLGLESLGGDRARTGAAFRTPLATLHAFQGWADQFTATPPAGVRDVYAGLSWPAGRWRLQAVAHRFSAEDGGGDYGRELDLAMTRAFGERYELLAKAAYFDAEAAGFVDTRKLWIMLSAAW